MIYKYLLVTLCLAHAVLAADSQRFKSTGLVISIDQRANRVFISHASIPGYMDAMAMPFAVHDQTLLKRLQPGMKVEFTLVVMQDSSYLDDIRFTPFESSERDPVQARSLKLLQATIDSRHAGALEIGQDVPDFSLVDQKSRAVSLSQFRGMVIEGNNTIQAVTAPSPFPAPGATTTNMQNDANVYITGGTITQIQVNGITTGITATTGQVVSVFLPAGGTISVTYTGSPSWTWISAL